MIRLVFAILTLALVVCPLIYAPNAAPPAVRADSRSLILA